MFQFLFVQMGFPVNGIHQLQIPFFGNILIKLFSDPPHKLSGFLGKPEANEGIHGKGRIPYTAQEINTAVRWGIPLVTIVLNNGCHGAEKAQQQRFFEQKYIGVDLINPRFDKVAEVYGARGFYIDRPHDIGDAVQEALALDEPSVIEIPVAEHFPLPASTPGHA
jgi:thiamine pyrophosphate-dependent acetolactate synthase large subunit-like protein